MSKEVKRYAPWDLENGMVEHQFGNWVDADDFEALLAENESLRGLYKMHQQTETREMRDLRADYDALLAERDRLREALNALRAATPSLTCESFHHARRDQHDHDEECPPFERWIAAALACNAALQGEQP